MEATMIEVKSLSRRVARLAGKQHGVVARWQLLALGMSKDTIRSWLRSGRLQRIHRGVYAVLHGGLSFAGRCVAAVLACGAGARLTGAAAGFVRGVERQQPRTIEVAAARQVRVPLVGVRVFYSRGAVPGGTEVIDGIPIVDVPRMLVDRAATAHASQLADIMHELDHWNLLDIDDVERCAAAFRNRQGKGPMRMQHAIRLHRDGSAGTQSAFERVNLGWFLDRGAPMPKITPHVEFLDGSSTRPDLLWEDWGLAVESDGFGHRRQRTKVADAEKDVRYAEIDIRCMRIRDHSVERDRLRILEHMHAIGMIRP